MNYFRKALISLVVICFIISCLDLPPEPSETHELVVGAKLTINNNKHSIFVDTTYGMEYSKPFNTGLPDPGISGANVYITDRFGTHVFIEDTTYYGVHGDYFSTMSLIPKENYHLLVEYENFDNLELDITVPSKNSILYPFDGDTIQIGRDFTVRWSRAMPLNGVFFAHSAELSLYF